MKISVIIPVYNAEKYLPVCLESLAIQTMRDFEVIIVDDCSTDSSRAVAENFLERFGGRLKIITLDKNTGSGSIPRNIGLEHARGEYVYFVDNDDLLIDNALETLYSLAQEYRTDVVYMEKFFTCNEEPVPQKFNTIEWQPELADDECIFESDNLSERVEKFLDKRFLCSPWSKFLRRDLLVDNDIKLPQMKIADDILWTFKIVCFAEKILRVSSRLYVHRQNSESVSRRKRTPQENIILSVSPLVDTLELFEEFMSSFELFRQNPDLRLRVLILFLRILFDDLDDDLKRMKPADVYEIILREFSAVGIAQPALSACLIVMTNIYLQTLKAKETS